MHAAAATKNDIFTLIGKPSPRLVLLRHTRPLMQHALGEDRSTSFIKSPNLSKKLAVLEQGRAAGQNLSSVLYSSQKGTSQCED